MRGNTLLKSFQNKSEDCVIKTKQDMGMKTQEVAGFRPGQDREDASMK